MTAPRYYSDQTGFLSTRHCNHTKQIPTKTSVLRVALINILTADAAVP